ncbi:MAG TPA: GTP 3',8-cyclase MoaA, partial [Bacteroidota bacterium]|nr:GTP 3',8-cyclase MoaA [Bacteroidota bacterium]
MTTLSDTFGRVVNNLRISVTDRCNFRCRYCMPEEGMAWLNKNMLLSFEEITRLVEIFAALGVTKIRLTGGEPLMRKELWRLVRMIRAVGGIRDIALTTNGYFLADQVRLLKDAGLDRINVSLDSMDPATFTAMVRRAYFDSTWKGIEEALRSGIAPVKVNVVLIRGVNDGEIESFAKLARSRPVVVRFIEFMPIGRDDGWSIDRVVPTSEVIARIGAVAPLVPVPVQTPGAPAEAYLFADGAGEIGVISSVTQPFCGDCNRVRITSDGKFRTCLFSLKETDLRALLRGGAPDEEIAATIVSAVR